MFCIRPYSVFAFDFRPTVVHKFIVRDTIEENVYKAISADAKKWDKNKTTLKLLKELFDNSTNDEQCQEETVNSEET